MKNMSSSKYSLMPNKSPRWSCWLSVINLLKLTCLFFNVWCLFLHLKNSFTDTWNINTTGILGYRWPSAITNDRRVPTSDSSIPVNLSANVSKILHNRLNVNQHITKCLAYTKLQTICNIWFFYLNFLSNVPLWRILEFFSLHITCESVLPREFHWLFAPYLYW